MSVVIHRAQADLLSRACLPRHHSEIPLLFRKADRDFVPALFDLPRQFSNSDLAFGVPACPPPAAEEKFRDRFERLDRFAQAIDSGFKFERGLQSGRLLEVSGSREVYFVGDLHGRLDNLAVILSHDGLWHKVSNGKAVLVFLGDIVHPEHSALLGDMESSYRAQQWLMDLKIAAPRNVYQMLGNHDYCSDTVTKNKVLQGQLYALELTRSKENPSGVSETSCCGRDLQCYLAKYQRAMLELPLVTLADGVVAAHAGPDIVNQQGVHDSYFLDRLRSLPVPDHQCLNDVRHQLNHLIWARPSLPAYPAPYYQDYDVERFLLKCGRNGETVFLGGHVIGAVQTEDNILSDMDSACWQSVGLGARQFFLHSGLNRPAYIRCRGSILELVYPGF